MNHLIQCAYVHTVMVWILCLVPSCLSCDFLFVDRDQRTQTVSLTGLLQTWTMENGRRVNGLKSIVDIWKQSVIKVSYLT